ncbi:MAG: tRNA preQ1(34) S-adenosylmethionine ribosyltransferase-isomerase QueA [Clostridiales bacterium GWF2_38_85]|nr:MAG: tRNA preQ1(34) S-adenosylmethionine ribosyltransferase-isomerase QueA [Clostridiales bacterium GWF2_38_85]HBL84202.1 tRNA preQ1(34) S-adenosylmethionine ribosyltransferase-isomerase QueA [Clostridiales bacterium]
MKTKSYFYGLDEKLIAQTPSEKRDKSRLLVLDKQNGAIEHKHFCDICEYLKPSDCVIINDTKVIPARLYGKSTTHTGKIEVVLIARDNKKGGEVWSCMTRPGKKTKLNEKITFCSESETLMTGTVIDILEGGLRLIKFDYDGIFNEILDKIGLMPLPPYITEKLSDKNRYQTVYAKYDGSAAAPTAGLHFTKELIGQLKESGVIFAEVLLHVGIGTFRPVKVENIKEHHMHTEHIEVTQETADKINTAKKNGGRIICVGTTSCRTLESVTDENGIIRPFSGDTGIFIYPSYKFKAIDALITNFHLPESTLLMLVSAFGGYENIMNAYKTAVEQKYRFFSFGDAMFIY